MTENREKTDKQDFSTESPFKGKTGFKRLINAVGYSFEGFKAAFAHEDAFRQEAMIALFLVPIALCLNVSGFEKALMIFSVLFVLIIELINSAIEAAVDHTSTARHALAKRAKDIGSAAVFLALVILVMVWSLILFT